MDNFMGRIPLLNITSVFILFETSLLIFCTIRVRTAKWILLEREMWHYSIRVNFKRDNINNY